METMKEFTEVLKNNPNGAYDFICNNYYNMSKEDLHKITKELLYAIYENVNTEKHNKILNDVAVEIIENYY